MKKQLYILILFVFQSFLINAQDTDADKRFNSVTKKVNSGNYEEAIKEFSGILEEYPDHFNSYLQRGFSYNMIKDHDGAIADFSKALELRPGHIWAYKNRGLAYGKLEKYDLAVDDFSKIIEMDEKNHEAYINRGFAKKARGDKKEACEDWVMAKKLGSPEAKLILKNNSCK